MYAFIPVLLFENSKKAKYNKCIFFLHITLELQCEPRDITDVSV